MLWFLLYIGVIFCLVVKCVVVVYVYWCELLFSSKMCCGCLFSSKMCCGCLCILV